MLRDGLSAAFSGHLAQSQAVDSHELFGCVRPRSSSGASPKAPQRLSGGSGA